MHGERTFLLATFCLGLLIWPHAPADAAAPWDNLLSFKRVEADPEKSYRVTNENGPWMILAASFSGEGAQEQARELVLELRKRYKIEAYTTRMRFDYGATGARGIDRFGAPLRMRYRRGSEGEEAGVLVGNFPAFDDEKAKEILVKIKRMQPKSLEANESNPTTQNMAQWRMGSRQTTRDRETLGPMMAAFVTTNPALPKGYFTSAGLDPMVVEMNKDAEHSLLDCPGKYTVQVATFKGRVVVKQQEIMALEQGKKFQGTLADAAWNAHRLAEALRLKGYEAYEFHDRYASIVTVGSFDSLGTPRRDGKTEINPKVHAVIKAFAAAPLDGPVPAGALPARVKTLIDIPFDVQPIPVEVPRRSIGHEMARGRFGGS
ncbi:MAG: hypothetical protein HQ567_30940 [Candidatus Nealsonbacteria bacterium]|nr:hypothetical protein [Candidatus Nealsonbacteria bacterium]